MKRLASWRDALKWHSTQIFALLAFIPIVWMEIPQDVKDAMIAEQYRPYVITAIAAIGVILRNRRQGNA